MQRVHLAQWCSNSWFGEYKASVFTLCRVSFLQTLVCILLRQLSGAISPHPCHCPKSSPGFSFFATASYTTHPLHTCTYSHLSLATHKPSYCFLKVEKLSRKHFSPKYWLPVLLPDDTVLFPTLEVCTIGVDFALLFLESMEVMWRKLSFVNTLVQRGMVYVKNGWMNRMFIIMSIVSITHTFIFFSNSVFCQETKNIF